ncbi:hypothetical protein G6F22_002256 [Rhizopus arrhizus]|nr:hypothetical protein G6F22_002256 [Rhizopus arrhizus]
MFIQFPMRNQRRLSTKIRLRQIAHCSNLVPDEQSESNVNRPDYKVDVYQAYKYLYTNVYGEIKASKSISSSLLANDFCRIAIFCKDALDQQKLNHTIGFQVTGTSVAWYAMYLMSNQLYTFTELASFNIPLKKCELLNLIGHLDDMLLVSKIHKTLCSAATENQDHLRCPTHSGWYTREFMQSKESKKRKLSLSLGNLL